jgi:hypothetical protein
MAADGGVDAVTKKVEAFGLAIDPARYENFNRSLEELKLIGLGLAVTFTEKVMPVFEGLLTYGQSLQGLSFTQVLDKLGEDFKNWADSIDWAGLSAKLIDKISSIDWAGIGVKVGTFFKNIFEGLSIIVQEVDWKGIFNVIGLAFLDFMAGLTGQGSWNNVKATWSANWEALKQIVSQAIQNVKDTVMNKFNEVKTNIHNKFVEIKSSITNAFREAANIAIGHINSIINAINNIPGVNLNLIGGDAGNNNRSGRASGGPVTGGQSYNVGEFYKPEVFRAPSSGRIESKGDISTLISAIKENSIDYYKMARIFRDTSLQGA